MSRPCSVNHTSPPAFTAAKYRDGFALNSLTDTVRCEVEWRMFDWLCFLRIVELSICQLDLTERMSIALSE
jgi:hypothetical protein